MSAAETAALKTAYKQERDRRSAERIQCIILFAQGDGVRELKDLLFVGIHTLATWIEAFRSHGLAGLRQWGYKDQEPELTAEQWAAVEQELARRLYHRVRNVAAFVKERFHIDYLIERLWRFVKDEVLNNAYYESFTECGITEGLYMAERSRRHARQRLYRLQDVPLRRREA